MLDVLPTILEIIVANRDPEPIIVFTVPLLAFPNVVQDSTHVCKSCDMTQHLSGVVVVVLVVEVVGVGTHQGPNAA